MGLFDPDSVSSHSKDGKQVSYKEHMELKRKREEKKELPKGVKIAIMIPVYIIAALALFYIPYLLFVVFSGGK